MNFGRNVESTKPTFLSSISADKDKAFFAKLYIIGPLFNIV